MINMRISEASLRVGFDISQLAHPGGVATYTQNLTAELSKLKDLEMVYFYSSLRKPYKGKLKDVKKFHFPPTFLERIFNSFRIFPIEKFIGEIAIYHSSDWLQPPTKAKKVTTYHDVIPLLFPKWSHPKIVEVHKKRLQIVEREIDMVIAVSENTKQDLLKVSSIPAEKIVVIYEGPSCKFDGVTKEEIEAFRMKYNLPEKFVLAMGGIGERKNLNKIKAAAKDFDLVISGETIPWIPQEELPFLYKAASVLLYPSLYEGFGLPVLDAMLAGTPVITSNISSLPEIGGDAVLYVDPENGEDIKEKLEELMSDEKLRKDLIAKGLKQASKFSWEKCAEKTAQVYANLVR